MADRLMDLQTKQNTYGPESSLGSYIPNNLEEKEKEKEKQILKKKEEQTQKEETKIVFVIKGSQHSKNEN